MSSMELFYLCTSCKRCRRGVQVSELINSAKLTDDDRLRLVMLFALKYERDGRPQVLAQD